MIKRSKHLSSGFIFSIFCLAIATMLLTGCFPNNTEFRSQVANSLSKPVQLHLRDVTTDPFVLRIHERAKNPGGDVTIYIEGEGDSWSSHRVPAQNPTPRDPVALHMAARDGGNNVAYIARPCQYIPLHEAGPCSTPHYWVEGRYAPEVVSSINQAIDNIKDRYEFKNIHLVGYAGGGALAVLVANERYDIASIRTAATILDHKEWSAKHDRVQLTHSLNPIDVAENISRIPQHHFMPQWADFDYIGFYAKYYQASGRSACVRASQIKDTDDDDGWARHWPHVLKTPVDCLNIQD